MMMLMASKELLVQLQTPLTFFLLIDVIITSYGLPQSPVWRKISSHVTLEGSQHQPLLPQSGAAVLLDSTAKQVWMFGGQATVRNKTTTLEQFWKLDLQTMKWIQIQQDREKWPSGRHHAVLCSRDNALVLAGGIQASGSSSKDVWRYDKDSQTWEMEVGYGNLLGNVTRFWCSGVDLFGLVKDESGTTLLQYHWDHKSWAKVPTRFGTKKATSELLPDLRNVSFYPMWPSERGFFILFAPADMSELELNSEQWKHTDMHCILWLLDKDIQWKPLLNDCAANNDCLTTSSANGKTKPLSGVLPSCRTHVSTWVDSNHNIWMHGGVSDTEALHDTWTYSLETKSWAQLEGECQKGCPGLDGVNIDPMVWTCNDTLFLFDGRLAQTSSNATLLASIWTIDISNFLERSVLSVPPVGVFLISLSVTFIVSLGTCVIIILVKCSSPMAPRIRPPVRTYGKVEYSPVSSDEVP